MSRDKRSRFAEPRGRSPSLGGGSEIPRCPNNKPGPLPDYLRRGLHVVFVGFNPGERSARLGHYYAGRGNQFWNFLFESRLLPERLRPEEDHRVLEFRLGLTDVVKRWSRSSNDLGAADYHHGIPQLLDRLREASPRVVAFNGKVAYEKFCGHPAGLGWQPSRIHGARVFVLPSTSGRNGSLTRPEKLEYFRRLARGIRRKSEARSQNGRSFFWLPSSDFQRRHDAQDYDVRRLD